MHFKSFQGKSASEKNEEGFDDCDRDSIASSRPSSPHQQSLRLGLDPDAAEDGHLGTQAVHHTNESMYSTYFDIVGSPQEEVYQDEDPPVPGLVTLRRKETIRVVPCHHQNTPIFIGNFLPDARGDNAYYNETAPRDLTFYETRCCSSALVVNSKKAATVAADDNCQEFSCHDLEATARSHSPPLRQLPLQTQTVHAYVQNTVGLRPFLQMSYEEFFEAKLIVLDLLGWGVPSEYLLHEYGLGLAPEFIYCAFTELNLKLPKDFDIDGIERAEPLPHGAVTLQKLR